MENIALHIYDIVENSINAQASLIEVIISYNTNSKLFSFTVIDNGKGMDDVTIKKVSDPFFTTRKTRKVGLGLSLLKQNCELAGGKLTIESKLNKGTRVEAIFDTGHIDCLPIGDIAGVLSLLMTVRQGYRLKITLIKNNEEFFNLDSDSVDKIFENVTIEPHEYKLAISQLLDYQIKQLIY